MHGESKETPGGRGNYFCFHRVACDDSEKLTVGTWKWPRDQVWMTVFRQACFAVSRIGGDRSHRTFLVSAFEWKFAANGPMTEVADAEPVMRGLPRPALDKNRAVLILRHDSVLSTLQQSNPRFYGCQFKLRHYVKTQLIDFP